MGERSIRLLDNEVRAIRDGRQTQLRRVVTWRYGDLGEWMLHRIQDGYTDGVPRAVFEGEDVVIGIKCPFGIVGDRLWTQEAFARDVPGCEGGISYRADHADPRGDGPANPMRWVSSITMPRTLSRMDLEVAAVRVERLQDITEEDARAEGIDITPPQIVHGHLASMSAREKFENLWHDINGKRAPWASNPWVWVLTFKVARS